MQLNDMNRFAVNLSFCGFMPNLVPGPVVYIGSRQVNWGGSVCLNEDDIVRYTTTTGDIERVGISAPFPMFWRLCTPFHIWPGRTMPCR